MLGRFLYFKIELKIGSLTFSTNWSCSLILKITRFLAISEKKLFETSAISYSDFSISSTSFRLILSLVTGLPESKGLTVFQNCLLLTSFFSFRFSNYFFFFSFLRRSKYLFLYLTWSMRVSSVICFRKLFLSLQPWPFHYYLRELLCQGRHLARAYFVFLGADLFKVTILILQNISIPSSLLTKTSFERLSIKYFLNVSLKRCLKVTSATKR